MYTVKEFIEWMGTLPSDFIPYTHLRHMEDEKQIKNMIIIPYWSAQEDHDLVSALITLKDGELMLGASRNDMRHGYEQFDKNHYVEGKEEIAYMLKMCSKHLKGITATIDKHLLEHYLPIALKP